MSFQSNNLLFIGNALLDIACQNDATELVKKYHLKIDDNCEAIPLQLPLFDELLRRTDITVTPGGSAQNSARVAKHVLQKKYDNNNCIVYFIGCIGNDKTGQILESEVKKSGVKTLYQYDGSSPTGVSACLVTSANERTCVANIGASALLSNEHFDAEHIKTALNISKICYVEGYVLVHSPITAITLAKITRKTGALMAINLSANYVVTQYYEELMHLMAFGDLIFCNRSEAITFATQFTGKVNDDIESAARLLVSTDKTQPINIMPLYNRIVFITQGPDDVIVALKCTDGTIDIRNYKVPSIVVTGDTIGAGDAFVGGVLSSLLIDSQIDNAVNCGIFIAAEICAKRGCTFH